MHGVAGIRRAAQQGRIHKAFKHNHVDVSFGALGSDLADRFVKFQLIGGVDPVGGGLLERNPTPGLVVKHHAEAAVVGGTLDVGIEDDLFLGFFKRLHKKFGPRLHGEQQRQQRQPSRRHDRQPARPQGSKQGQDGQADQQAGQHTQGGRDHLEHLRQLGNLGDAQQPAELKMVDVENPVGQNNGPGCDPGLQPVFPGYQIEVDVQIEKQRDLEPPGRQQRGQPIKQLQNLRVGKQKEQKEDVPVPHKGFQTGNSQPHQRDHRSE